jgi:hypothetical protein
MPRGRHQGQVQILPWGAVGCAAGGAVDCGVAGLGLAAESGSLGAVAGGVDGFFFGGLAVAPDVEPLLAAGAPDASGSRCFTGAGLAAEFDGAAAEPDPSELEFDDAFDERCPGTMSSAGCIDDVEYLSG